ncbi:hypothetical protein BOX15_Mlig034521g3 [Macrostomum lignano]|uniref:Uncharacterized protein n=1 Tax=Macrostomum lignano TaxID=282301 RepID=A0A267DSP3_9PLAT|nr:hypothetical protein BOX15_Mlig034521g2 [Macrostomum lignano]PAA74743.1 hypothetical protein BOX15_Mlig034521g3 [Macrostomum lignano]
MATFSSESPQQQQLEGGERSRKKRFITLTKYPLKEQPVQLPPASSSGNRKKQSSFPSASEVRILTAQAETSVACNGRLIGLYCTAGYVAMAIRQRDNNIKIQIYNCDLWPISSEQLLRNPSLVREATEAGDIVNEKVQCVTVDKAEQTLMYFHTYRLISAGNKQMRRLCSISLPDLQVHRRLQLKDDVKSIKVGSKFFALYFRDCRLAVYCKSSRSVVFEFSAQKLGCLFLPGDTFELDSQDRLVEVSEKRVRSLFYNGVTYRDCDCANLQELISGGRRRLIGRRAEFYEALQCHLATLRLGQQQQQQQQHHQPQSLQHQQHQPTIHTAGNSGGGCSRRACTMKTRLRVNTKLLRRVEQHLCTAAIEQQRRPTALPILVCEDAFWLEAVVAGAADPVGVHQTAPDSQQQQQQKLAKQPLKKRS